MHVAYKLYSHNKTVIRWNNVNVLAIKNSYVLNKQTKRKQKNRKAIKENENKKLMQNGYYLNLNYIFIFTFENGICKINMYM